MKALMKLAQGPDNVELRDLPKPELPSPDWVIVRVKASGICGSDLHIYHGTAKFWPPFVIGHEFAGEIAELGPNVTNWKKGDRVVSETHTGHCGVCRLCREGKIQYCASKRPVGFGTNGGFAELVAVPAMFLHRIPDNVSYEVAALAEPLTVVVNQIAEKGLVAVSDYAVVLGSGAIGLLSGFVAKTLGARKVLMTGLDASEPVRFPAAKKVGIDEVFNAQKGLAGPARPGRNRGRRGRRRPGSLGLGRRHRARHRAGPEDRENRLHRHVSRGTHRLSLQCRDAEGPHPALHLQHELLRLGPGGPPHGFHAL